MTCIEEIQKFLKSTDFKLVETEAGPSEVRESIGTLPVRAVFSLGLPLRLHTYAWLFLWLLLSLLDVSDGIGWVREMSTCSWSGQSATSRPPRFIMLYPFRLALMWGPQLCSAWAANAAAIGGEYVHVW